MRTALREPDGKSTRTTQHTPLRATASRAPVGAHLKADPTDPLPLEIDNFEAEFEEDWLDADERVELPLGCFSARSDQSDAD